MLIHFVLKSCWLTPWCLAVIGLQIRMINLASGSKPLLYVIFWISQDLSTICILQYDTRITIYAAVVCHYIIYTIVCLYVWSCFLQFHPTKTSRCGASNFISLTTTWRWCVPCWHWKASLWRPTVTWRKFCRPCRTLPSWVAGGSTMFFQNMHRRPCMTCVFFTACQLYSLFFWNHSANSYGPQKLVMIWARAVFYSVLGVGRLYWRYILLVVLVSKMQGYPLRRHWQPTSVTHLWKPTSLDSTQQKTCRWTYVG